MNIFQTINQYLAWNQHLAGWAQFLGAMIAIGVTARVALAPIKAEQAARLDERRAFNAVVRDSMDIWLEKLATLREIASAGPNTRAALGQALIDLDRNASRTIEKVLEIPVDKWPSASLHARADALLISVRGFLMHVEATLRDLSRQGPYDGPPYGDEAWKRLRSAEDELVLSQASFGKSLSRLIERPRATFLEIAASKLRTLLR